MIMVSFQCFLLIGQYLNYGKTISIVLRDEPLAQFPHITFCSEFFVPRDTQPHPFFTKLSEIAKQQLAEQYRDTLPYLSLPNDVIYQYIMGNRSRQYIMQMYHEYEQKYNYFTDYQIFPNKYNYSVFEDLLDMVQLSGPHKPYSISNIRPEDYFFDCTFANVKCNFSNFVVHRSDSYGNCFTFNSPALAPDPSPGSEALVSADFAYSPTQRSGDRVSAQNNGLRLKLRLCNDSDQVRASTRGIRIAVHEANELPSFAEDRAVFTGMGVDAHIKFSQKALLRFNNKRERCSDHWPIEGDQFSKLAYNSKVCRKLCVEDALFRECRCVLSSLHTSVYPNRQQCRLGDNATQHLCWLRHNMAIDHDNQKECDEKCHLPCREVQYELKLWSSKYPHENSMIPEMLGYLKSGNDLIKSDTMQFLEELIKIAKLSSSNSVETCHKRLQPRPTRGHNSTGQNSSQTSSLTSIMVQLACIVRERPNTWLQELIADRRSFDTLLKIRSMYAILHVTESTHEHETKSESPEIELPNLLAEFGGVLGLWVGISIITLMEFFEIITFSICFLKNSWTEKSKALRLTIRQKHEQYRHSRARPKTSTRSRLQSDFKSESTNAITTIINSYVD